jgi:hypothetical protein
MPAATDTFVCTTGSLKFLLMEVVCLEKIEAVEDGGDSLSGRIGTRTGRAECGGGLLD